VVWDTSKLHGLFEYFLTNNYYHISLKSRAFCCKKCLFFFKNQHSNNYFGSKVSQVEIRHRADTICLETTLPGRQLLWFGLVIMVAVNRLPLLRGPLRRSLGGRSQKAPENRRKIVLNTVNAWSLAPDLKNAVQRQRWMTRPLWRGSGNIWTASHLNVFDASSARRHQQRNPTQTSSRLEMCLFDMWSYLCVGVGDCGDYLKEYPEQSRRRFDEQLRCKQVLHRWINVKKNNRETVLWN